MANIIDEEICLDLLRYYSEEDNRTVSFRYSEFFSYEIWYINQHIPMLCALTDQLIVDLTERLKWDYESK